MQPDRPSSTAELVCSWRALEYLLPEDQRIRMRFGLEAFPVSFAQVAAFYTLLEDVPQVTTDVDKVSIEFHLHF